jgi:hypothetical protein
MRRQNHQRTLRRPHSFPVSFGLAAAKGQHVDLEGARGDRWLQIWHRNTMARMTTCERQDARLAHTVVGSCAPRTDQVRKNARLHRKALKTPDRRTWRTVWIAFHFQKGNGHSAASGSSKTI